MPATAAIDRGVVRGKHHPRTLGAAALCIAIGASLAVGVTTKSKPDGRHVGTVVPQGTPTPMRLFFEAGLDSLISSVIDLQAAVADPHSDRTRAAFRRARVAYKRVEFLLSYYSPTTVTVVNGPADVDDPDGPPAPLGARAGFGVIEAVVFGKPKDVPASRQRSSQAVNSMVTSLRALRASTGLLTIGDTSALDAMRLELARVMTTGIAGYDSDESGDAITESAAALDGVHQGLTQLTMPGVADARARAIDRVIDAARSLHEATDFDSFDRFTFTSGAGSSAGRALLALRYAIDSHPPASRRLWRPFAATPFDSDAFDPSALAPEYAPRATPELVALGRRLFFDPRLSGTGTRSCASCHAPAKSFTDGRARAEPLASRRAPLRNTPTLVNAALQPSMFADERAGFVEDQIRMVLSSPAEMASSPDFAAQRTGLDERSLRVALATYIRTLTALDSRFDRAIRGDTAAVTPAERRGFNLFTGKARCGSCHFAPLFGGTLPPDYTRSELEIIGVPAGVPALRAASHAAVDQDVGREAVDHWAEHRYAFRVPTIRNAALTAPYMHNGVFKTLEQVVDFYDRGGGAGLGEILPSQTLAPHPLHLTAREKSDLVAFVRSVTDSSSSVAKP